jgi:hypothetical protein
VGANNPGFVPRRNLDEVLCFKVRSFCDFVACNTQAIPYRSVDKRATMQTPAGTRMFQETVGDKKEVTIRLGLAKETAPSDPLLFENYFGVVLFSLFCSL